MTLPRNTKAARLEAAGFTYVAGWVPATYLDTCDVIDIIEHYRPDAERIAKTAPKRGRPKKPNPASPQSLPPADPPA